MSTDTDVFRPRGWTDYHGQSVLKARMETHIQAARRQDRVLPPILFTGPPGCGKTSLGHITATRLGQPLEVLDMTAAGPKTFVNLFKRFQYGVLLLDEVHRTPTALMENLLTMVEKNYMTLPNGRKVHLGAISFLGATSERAMVSTALRDRFLIPDFDEYSEEEMSQIVKSMATKVELKLPKKTCDVLGRAAAGLPRTAGRFVLSARDIALNNSGRVPSPETILEFCRTTPDGLSRDHLSYLETLNQVGGQAGERRLAQQLRISPAYLLELDRLVVSRYGYVTYTPQGRELTHKGFRRINVRQ